VDELSGASEEELVDDFKQRRRADTQTLTASYRCEHSDSLVLHKNLHASVVR
jgi:hypothetical protein